MSPKVLLSIDSALLLEGHDNKIDFSYMKQAYQMMEDLQFPKT
jgi:hypothetical protein